MFYREHGTVASAAVRLAGAGRSPEPSQGGSTMTTCFRSLRAAALALAGGLVLQSAALAQDVKWTYLTILPPTHPMVAPLVQAFDRIKERSGGKFVIQTNRFSETPHKATDGMQVLRDGLADMSEWYAGYVTNTFPLLAAAELPYVTPAPMSTEDGLAAFRRAWAAPSVKAALDETMAKFKCRVAVRTYLEPINLWTTGKVEDPTNLSGLRLRANTREMGDMITAVGAAAQFMPITDVYPAAQRNVISGLFTSANAILSLKLFEVTKHLTIANSQFVSGGYLVRNASYEKLSPELKKLFDEEMAATEAFLGDFTAKADHAAIEALPSHGVTVSRVTPEQYAALRKIAEEKVWSAWKTRAGADGEKVLAEILAAVAAK